MTPNSIGGQTVADELRRALRRQTILTVVLYLALIGGGIKVYIDSKNTTDALCAFRQDLAQRVLATADFLEEHPSGIPGVPIKIMLQQLSNQQRTVTALKTLNCPAQENP